MNERSQNLIITGIGLLFNYERNFVSYSKQIKQLSQRIPKILYLIFSKIVPKLGACLRYMNISSTISISIYKYFACSSVLLKYSTF